MLPGPRASAPQSGCDREKKKKTRDPILFADDTHDPSMLPKRTDHHPGPRSHVQRPAARLIYIFSLGDQLAAHSHRLSSFCLFFIIIIIITFFFSLLSPPSSLLWKSLRFYRLAIIRSRCFSRPQRNKHTHRACTGRRSAGLKDNAPPPLYPPFSDHDDDDDDDHHHHHHPDPHLPPKPRLCTQPRAGI